MAYTNSQLVAYTKLSPNNSGQRNQSITKITIHHMAGNLSVETCGNVFANTDREASANYGIGTDGRIGMYVEECNRAWTSSSPANDNCAVTIEVANDEIGGNWRVSDTAFNALIDLCADICKRNGFRLSYDGTPNAALTRHNMFAATNCPGTYLQSRFDEIVQLVNARLDGGETAPQPEQPAQPDNNVNATYMARTQTHGWLPEVTNLNDFAGFEGAPITDIAVKVDKGSVKYRVHVLGGGWLPYVTGCNTHDHQNGYAGELKPIDAIEIYYYTPDTIRPYKCAKYKVNNYGWQLDNNTDNGQDGYAGVFGVPITELRLIIE